MAMTPIAPPSKIFSIKKLLTLRELWRWESRSVVFTNGIVDILHAGHVKVIRSSPRSAAWTRS